MMTKPRNRPSGHPTPLVASHRDCGEKGLHSTARNCSTLSAMPLNHNILIAPLIIQSRELLSSNHWKPVFNLPFSSVKSVRAVITLLSQICAVLMICKSELSCKIGKQVSDFVIGKQVSDFVIFYCWGLSWLYVLILWIATTQVWIPLQIYTPEHVNKIHT